MKARDAAIAMRTVIDEAYADRRLATISSSAISIDGGMTSTTSGYLKSWNIGKIAQELGDTTGMKFYYDASDLMSTMNMTSKDMTYPNTWRFNFLGPDNASSTLLNADGFMFQFYPEGSGKNLPVVIVTYHLEHLDETIGLMPFLNSVDASGKYNSNVGYKVYHFDTAW
ncbi:MAG: hypothetical protein LBO70_05105 [Clostridiales Family XIII bacterium]|jgi:hypothetical protein|nr:hypothetical protein [Clostridiales Family XIII bacterium]